MSDALLGAGAQTVGGAAHFAGGIVQGQAARQQGLYQNRVAQINAQLSQMQAKDSIRRGDLQSSQMIQRGDQAISAQRASFGASGVDPNSGSAAQAQASTRAISQLDALTISHNAQLEALGYNLQGSNFLAGGKMAKIAADNTNTMDIMSGGLKFGQSLMQGASNYNQYRPRVPITPLMDPLHQNSYGNWGGSNESEGPEDAAPINNDASQSPWGGSNQSEGTQAP